MINFQQIMRVMGGNPNMFIANQMRNNPQIAQFQNQMINMQRSSGMSSRDFAIQYAKQNGINEQQLIQMANMLGLK